MLTSSSARLDFATKFLLAHEMFHSWNAAKLGEIQTENPYWFTEGFTDYYARLLLLRAKLITPQEFAADIEIARREYLASPVLHASGKQIHDRFFTDLDFQRLAYLRGDFLAFRWNRIIQTKTNGKQSLDDGMLDLERQAQRKEIVLTSDFLAAHFERYVGPDAVHDVQRFIDEGDTVPYTDSPAAEPER